MLTINNTHQIISLSVEIVATTLLLICALKNRKPTLLVPWLVLRGSVMPVLIGISLYLTALLTIKIGIKTGMAFMAVSLIATGNFTDHVQFSLYYKVDRICHKYLN